MEASKKYIVIEGEATTNEEAIILCVKALHEAGYVEMGFLTDCLHREKEYPTGLYTETPVAIPHSKSEHIKNDGICYLRLKAPVAFRQMDDCDKEMQTRHIFTIAMQDGNAHIGILRSMMRSFSNQEFMDRLEKEDIAAIPALLGTYLQ